MADETQDETQPPARVRRQKPDKAVETENDTGSPDVESGEITAEDQADEDDGTEEPSGEEVKSEAIRTPKFEPPFIADGIHVKDKAGRAICFVAMAHATMEVREATAKMIADKLNG